MYLYRFKQNTEPLQSHQKTCNLTTGNEKKYPATPIQLTDLTDHMYEENRWIHADFILAVLDWESFSD